MITYLITVNIFKFYNITINNNHSTGSSSKTTPSNADNLVGPPTLSQVKVINQGNMISLKVEKDPLIMIQNKWFDRKWI